MTTQLHLDTNQHIAVDLELVMEAIATLPESSRAILKGIAYEQRPMEEMASALGTTKREVEKGSVVALLTLCHLLPQTLGGAPQQDDKKYYPLRGTVAAMHAVAKHYIDSGRRQLAVAQLAKAAFTACESKAPTDAISAYRSAAEEFAHQAAAKGNTDADRQVFLTSAMVTFQKAAAIAEATRDDLRRGQILAHLTQVELDLNDIDMARVHATIATRAAKKCGNRLLANQVRRSIIIWHLAKAQALIPCGQLATAEEHAMRAQNFCTKHLTDEAISAQALLDEIASLAGVTDHKARMRQLAECIRESEAVDDEFNR